MSELSIAQYFPFMPVKITEQSVYGDSPDSALIRLASDLRYRPVCHACGSPAATVHSQGHRRHVRDLNLAVSPVWLDVEYRKVWCDQCDSVRVERIAKMLRETDLTITQNAQHTILKTDDKTVHLTKYPGHPPKFNRDVR